MAPTRRKRTKQRRKARAGFTIKINKEEQKQVEASEREIANLNLGDKSKTHGSKGQESEGSGDIKGDDYLGEDVSGSKGKESKDHLETARDDFLGIDIPVSRRRKLTGCACCGEYDHLNVTCPFLKYIPEGAKIGRCFETMCRGCHHIGKVCCVKRGKSVGGYAMLKRCAHCLCIGHWEWEDCEDCPRPKDVVYEKPEYLDGDGISSESEDEDEDAFRPRNRAPWGL
ncbi:uncharacterized protein LOC133742175 isoform X2 [Rosa rugosa]|uniref:uncharacterized protein LOC133742175 isoform X2 n=1 Tax=Rosa rugosa TaxID=74645 RepID=UPI002B4141CC|nr:uncharacterized protein LOC133742175 isoform X2 [Rosa rugosa]